MLSADDAEYPREYRTLGGGGGGGSGGRRFSNVGLVHTSERRHTVIAAQSLEALSGLQKADADRKRDAFMDHLKSKYPQHALALRGQQDRMREQVSVIRAGVCRDGDLGQSWEPGVGEFISRALCCVLEPGGERSGWDPVSRSLPSACHLGAWVWAECGKKGLSPTGPKGKRHVREASGTEDPVGERKCLVVAHTSLRCGRFGRQHLPCSRS